MSNNDRPLSSEERLARLAARTADRRPNPGPRTAPNGSQPAAGKTPVRRRHAAQGSRTAALTLSAVTTVGLAAWLQVDSSSSVDASGTISSSSSTDTTASATANSSSTDTAATEDSSNATASDSSTSTGAATVETTDSSASSTGLADGTYTGDSASTKWGDVTVQITVSDGVISDVSVLEYPDNDNKSAQISQRSLPTLISETLTNQSADVDSVSGATYTSQAYKSSLQSAIDTATAEASA